MTPGCVAGAQAAYLFGWFGLLVAVLGGWLGLLAPIFGVFQIVSTIGSVAFAVWMVLMGIALLRSREVDAPAVA